MNFLFNSNIFEKNSTLNEYNNFFLPQHRSPFTDITQQMNIFSNYKKKQQNNAFTKNFNGKENFTFLRKKSNGEKINNCEKDEEKESQNIAINKPRKYFNNCYNNQNSLINNLEEEDEDENKENCQINFEYYRKGKDENISIIQILNDAIREKKENDKYEKERKKANKLKQLKMLLKHKKNSQDYSSKNIDESNKEKINNNSQINYLIGIQEQRREKEINIMNLD